MLAHLAGVVLPLPAGAAKIPETNAAAAKIGALLDAAHRTQRVFQVRVDLHLKKKDTIVSTETSISAVSAFPLDIILTLTLLLNLVVLIWIKAAATAFM